MSRQQAADKHFDLCLMISSPLLHSIFNPRSLTRQLDAGAVVALLLYIVAVNSCTSVRQ